jgi:hypothetical protein
MWLGMSSKNFKTANSQQHAMKQHIVKMVVNVVKRKPEHKDLI